MFTIIYFRSYEPADSPDTKLEDIEEIVTELPATQESKEKIDIKDGKHFVFLGTYKVWFSRIYEIVTFLSELKWCLVHSQNFRQTFRMFSTR